VPIIPAIDGSLIEVRNRTKFRVDDGIFSVKRVKSLEKVAGRSSGTTPIVICVFEGGICPEAMPGLSIGQECPFPGDVVAEFVKQSK
jgi:hypothetical protein